MSLQTKEKEGQWELETFDKEVFYLTNEEHTILQQLMLQNEIKFAIFDDGELALSSIKIIRRLPDRDNQLQLGEPEITDEQRAFNIKKITEIKASYLLKIQEASK